MNIGNKYVLGLRAVNCQGGDTLALKQVQAEGKGKVLDSLGNAATKLRTELGESLSSVHRFDTPIEQATTPSFEALKAYSLGIKTGMKPERLRRFHSLGKRSNWTLILRWPTVILE